MKHLYLTLALIGLSYGASAAFVDTSNNKQTTVAEALKLSDNTPITLEGNIQKHLRKDRYQFSDATGQMVVEIKNNRWNDVDITPNDKVRLTGEIDKDNDGTKLDVKRVDLVK